MTQPIDPKVAEVFADDLFPFTTDLTVKPLDQPVVPEPPRVGAGGVGCRSCGEPDASFVWYDENWRLRALRPSPLRGVVLLETRTHLDSFSDFPTELLAALGPMIGRIEAAILGIGDIARVHVNRWGDGGEHFHLWFLPRPLGAMQLRGSPLPLWLDVLPALPDEEVDRALTQIAAALR